jgi:tRNA G18 (ribose-2'-O)-methylase SpoU
MGVARSAMPRWEIDSIDDPRLAVYRNLKRTNATRWSGLFIAEGDKLVRRLLASRFAVESVVVGHKHVDQVAPLVPADVPLYVLPEKSVESLVGFNFHRGVLACGRRGGPPALADVVRQAAASPTLVVLPELNDPENLGSIIRTATALGVDGAILGPSCVDPFSRRVLRVSMGASLALPLVPSARLDADLDILERDYGFELLVTVLDGSAETLEGAARSSRQALLFGSEGLGLDPRWIARCPRRVTIPMRRGADSLNVAVAAGIVLHHFTCARPPANPY